MLCCSNCLKLQFWKCFFLSAVANQKEFRFAFLLLQNLQIIYQFLSLYYLFTHHLIQLESFSFRIFTFFSRFSLPFSIFCLTTSSFHRRYSCFKSDYFEWKQLQNSISWTKSLIQGDNFQIYLKCLCSPLFKENKMHLG